MVFDGAREGVDEGPNLKIPLSIIPNGWAAARLHIAYANILQKPSVPVIFIGSYVVMRGFI